MLGKSPAVKCTIMYRGLEPIHRTLSVHRSMNITTMIRRFKATKRFVVRIITSADLFQVFNHPPGRLVHVPTLAFIIDIRPMPWISTRHNVSQTVIEPSGSIDYPVPTFSVTCWKPRFRRSSSIVCMICVPIPWFLILWLYRNP